VEELRIPQMGLPEKNRLEVTIWGLKRSVREIPTGDVSEGGNPSGK